MVNGGAQNPWLSGERILEVLINQLRRAASRISRLLRLALLVLKDLDQVPERKKIEKAAKAPPPRAGVNFTHSAQYVRNPPNIKEPLL